MTDEEHPTRAGSRLIFMFHKTEIERIIRENVQKIEVEAYNIGYTDGLEDRDIPNLDIPVMPEDPQ